MASHPAVNVGLDVGLMSIASSARAVPVIVPFAENVSWNVIDGAYVPQRSGIVETQD
jgi:hypothetical protein